MSKRTPPGIQLFEENESKSTENLKKPKLSFNANISSKKELLSSAAKKGIQIKLSSQKEKTTVSNSLKPPSQSVASVFGEESDEEPEEMPPEARMRMRNIGRDTPTSAGPNSYGKTKQGFLNVKKVFEKNLEEAALECSGDKPAKPKFKF